MSNLQSLIEKNLYLRVDFDNRYKKTEQGIMPDTKYFLIGVLPVVIFYKNGEWEKASMNYSLPVAKDPFLRLLQGVKATDQKVKPHKDKIKDIVRKLEGGFLKTIEFGKFKGQDFEKILIINFDLKDAGNSKHKNRRNQAICQERQETPNQAN